MSNHRSRYLRAMCVHLRCFSWNVKIAVRLGACSAAMLLTAFVYAQTYPAKPIQMLIPLATASAVDVMLRIVAQKMSDHMGQQIAIENQPGAAGLIGGERVARAAPDGYNLGGFSDTVVNAVPILYPKAAYDPINSFAPISMVAGITVVMFVHPSIPARNVKELVALAKARPGQLEFASGGNGSPMHISMEMFKSATGTNFTHVPYKGSTQAVLDVISGRVPVMITSLAAVLPSIKVGKLRALGVVSTQRSPLVPDVPTLSESGVPGFVFLPWGAIYAPQGTAKPIIDRLSAEVGKAVNDTTVRERLLALGFEPASSTPEQLREATRDGYAKMSKIIKDAGIKVE